MSEDDPTSGGRALNDLILAETRIDILIGKIVFDRIPFAFESADQYALWRTELSAGFDVDARDIVVVGSGATGRSFNPRNRFGTFNVRSDLDIAVISPSHFDAAWSWFRKASPNNIGLDDRGLHLFKQHRAQYVFDGYIASDYFLAYLPFGDDWLRALRRCEMYLPTTLRGKAMKVRIYRDNDSLRKGQRTGLESYRRVLEAKQEAKSGE